MNRLAFRFPVVVLAVLILGGCGEPGPKLVKAGGTVKMKGVPVSGATVVLHYPDGNSAVGVTNDQGVFDLAYNGRSGALPAEKIKVTVTKIKGEVAAAKAGPPKDMDPTKMMAEHFAKQYGGKAPTTAQTPQNELPEKYAKPETSGLTVDVPASGVDDLVLNLTD